MVQVFISLRFNEALKQGEMLKKELEGAGVSVFLCAVDIGENIALSVANNLVETDLVVILGTASYGEQTSSSYSTHQELTYVMEEKKPFLLIKMCDQFLNATARFYFNSTVKYYDWPKISHGTIPADVVPMIIEELHRVGSPMKDPDMREASIRDKSGDKNGRKPSSPYVKRAKQCIMTSPIAFALLFLLLIGGAISGAVVGATASANLVGLTPSGTTSTPSKSPSLSPTTKSPTQSPSSLPTPSPTGSPVVLTKTPTKPPTSMPTVSPTFAPTFAPSKSPTITPLLSDNFKMLALGEAHSCVLYHSGSVKCWGHAQNGECGDGAPTAHRALPVSVSGLTSSATYLVSGKSSTCVLLDTGGVMCWGMNSFGECGVGSTAVQASATAVTGLSSNAVEIYAGNYHMCALLDSGAVKCWGRNDYNQLNDGTAVDKSTPNSITNFPGTVISLSLGALHSCALFATNSIGCWGYNGYGQLGNGGSATSSSPVSVTGLPQGTISKVISGDYYSCAVYSSTGSVYCWGMNNFGQIGDLDYGGSRNQPNVVTGLTSDVNTLAGSYVHTCALMTTGAMQCLGANTNGQLGDNSLNDHSSAATVSGLGSDIVAIAVGGSHSCAILSNADGIKCFGRNFYGQVGDGTFSSSGELNRLTPVQVLGVP